MLNIKKITGIGAIIIGISAIADIILSHFRTSQFASGEPPSKLFNGIYIFISELNHIDLTIFSQSFIFQIIPLVFALLLVIGGLVYVSSDGRNEKLVLFSWSVIFFGKVLYFLAILLRFPLDQFIAKGSRFTNFEQINVLNSFKRPFFLLYFVLSILVIYLAYYILKHHYPNKHLVLPVYSSSLGVNKGSRLLNYIIDGLMISILAFPITYRLVSLYTNVNLYELRYINEDDIYMLFIIFQLALLVLSPLYYVIMEGLFQRTIGKMLTGTYVNATGAKGTNMGTAALRTLCRFIPFNPVSFLFNSNWHDRVSQSTVLEDNYTDEEVEKVLSYKPKLRVKTKSKYHKGFGEY